MNKINKRLLLTLAGVAFSKMAMADVATYELRQINVIDGSGTQLRCHFVPGVVKHISDLGTLTSEQDIAIIQDESQVQAWVDAAPGLTPPSFSGLTKNYTNWWVRTSPAAPFKLIRSNTSENPGGQVLQDESDAGQKLAVFMGINCFKVFPQ